jgi:hypothetical protein
VRREVKVIVTGMDQRNIALAADLLQAKMVVAVLRMAATFPIYRRLLVDAAELVNRDGFRLTGEDVRVACENWGNILGHRTDMCKATVDEPPAIPTPPPPEEPKVTVH